MSTLKIWAANNSIVCIHMKNETKLEKKKKEKTIHRVKWFQMVGRHWCNSKLQNFQLRWSFLFYQVGAQIQMKIHIQIFQVKTWPDSYLLPISLAVKSRLGAGARYLKLPVVCRYFVNSRSRVNWLKEKYGYVNRGYFIRFEKWNWDLSFDSSYRLLKWIQLKPTLTNKCKHFQGEFDSFSLCIYILMEISISLNLRM